MHPLSCCWLKDPKETHQDPGRQCRSFETLEIGVAVLCSVVTWEYTVQNDRFPGYDDSLFEDQVEKKNVEGFVFRPSPSLMLFSCLVFGCCVSSFTHRRQDEDALQFPVFAVLLTGAIVAGHAFGASVHLILLGYLPWAMCVAMAASFSGHSLYRWLRREAGTGRRDEEKAAIVG